MHENLKINHRRGLSSISLIFPFYLPMNFDYRFPLFDDILHGRLSPLLQDNAANTDFKQRLEEQIIESTKDMGSYKLSFIKPQHPKAEYYRRMLLSETFQYCNDLLDYLQDKKNLKIRAYLRNLILDKHLTSCLKRLGEQIDSCQLSLNLLTSAPPSDVSIESISNCYVFQLLKVCVSKVYLEVQNEFADLISIPQSESMLYAAYLNELSPIRTFLSKRPERDKVESRQKETVNQAPKNQPTSQAPVPEEEKPSTEFMLVQEAALKLKVSVKTIRRRLESGELKGKKDKGKWLIDKTAFESYLNTL